MSVAVLNSTVLSPLWRAGEADGAPASVPVSEDGVFLSFQLQGSGRGPHCTSNAASNNANITTAATTDHEAVTFVAFHPVDETCFVFGTESGRAYGVSLQDNKLFLLANLGSGGGGALRCGIFCPGYLTSPIVVVVKAPHRLVFVDWQRGTVVQEVAHTAHTQPILRLLTGPSTDSLICAVSADAFSCWEPVTNATAAAAPAEPQVSENSPFGAGGRSSRQHGGAAEATAAALPSTGAVDAKGGEEKLPTAPRYICTSNAEPTQRTRGSVLGHASVPMHGSKGPHRFLSLHVIEPTLLLSVESNNILSLWSRTQGSGGHAAPLDSGVLENAASGAAARTASRVQLLDSVTAPPTLRVRCSAQCGELIALGADAVATSKRGPVVEPVVAFVHTRTLAGTGVVRLPTSGASTSGAMHVVATNSARTTPTVVSVSALHSDLVACLLSTGTLHVVLASTYHLVFTIQPPATATPPSTADAARWSFAPSGPTFGAMFRNRTLALLHLPTARKEAASASATRGDVASAPLLRNGDTRGDVRRGSPVKAGGIVRPSVQRSSAPLPPVTLALPFLRHPRSSKPSIAGTAAFLEDGAAASPSLRHQRKPEAELPAAAQEVLAVCRAPIPVPKRGFPSQWVDVNLVDMRFSDTDGIHAGEDTVEKAEDTSSAPSTSATRALSEQALWSEAKFCDTLSAVSCQYNLEQLRAHLVKFGVFPHTFRRFTWRFLAGLPSRARTASQFAAVARRPRHVAVEQLMRPFPLPHNATRQAVEEALSCLCWAAPVLTLAFYLPVLVYPLVMLYREDVQTVVELALVFFENWGREFFVCHPRGPLSVLTAMERELGRLDAALSQHLVAVGATVDVWGWELMTTFYTDVLTGAEWLQVMDHAFATAPLWLYAFHLSLLRTRLRAPLMAAVSADEVRGVLSHAGSPAGTPTAAATTTSLKVVIEEAYRLHGEVAKRVESGGGETAELAGYTHFRTLSPRFEYTSENLPHDPVIFAEKMRELALVQRRRDEEVAATKRYTALRTEAAAAAAKEATFLQQQRARAAATFDASAAAWQVQVALEKGRQEQEAQEQQLRWEAVQRRTRNAAALASLHTEMRTVESQLRHDMVDRHMEQLKWGLAAHLTEEELARLQQSAEVEVERAVRCIDHDVAVQADTLARFHDEPVLQIERPGVDGAESATEERDIEDTVGEETAVKEEMVTPPDDRQDGAADSRTNRGHDSEGGGDAQVEVLAPAGAATTRSSKDDESEARVSRHPAAAPTSSHQTNSTATATSSKSACHDPPVEASLNGRVSKAVGSEEDAAAGVAAVHAAPSQEANDGAHGDEADTTTLSANTQRYASPGREGSASAQQQPRVHAVARHHRPPPRRHGLLGSETANTTTSTSSRTSCAKTAPSATLQSFVELRNRVLQRLQPANEHVGSNAKQRPHKAPGSSCFPSSSDTAERDAHTSTSYTTSYTTTSSAAEAERSYYHERTPHSTATATTTTASALWSRSYSTSYSCPSSSYYDYYGTGRTTTSSATSSSHPHTTTP